MSDRGMVPREDWESSDIHKASTYYCAKCGEQFDSPHNLYDHLDAKHPKDPVVKFTPAPRLVRLVQKENT